MQDFVLDFYEDPNETSSAIYENIKTKLDSNGLKIENCIAYSADNTSTNYGCQKSVFVNLQSENESIIHANCNAHVIHNSAKFGLKKLPFNVETLIFDIFSHFSVSAKRNASLKQCYVFTECVYKKMIRHCPTRWLTLFKAVTRIIEDYDAIKAYFSALSEEETPESVLDFFNENVENDVSICEMYLLFVESYMEIFQFAILDLEKKNFNATHIYDIMAKVERRLSSRLATNERETFVGIKLASLLRNSSSERKRQFLFHCNLAYENALSYLRKWFKFDNSIFKLLKHVNLDEKIKIEVMQEIANKLNVKVDDSLFDEIEEFNKHYETIQDSKKQENNVQHWTNALKSKQFPFIEKIMETILAIPVSNANCERVFSLMKRIYKVDRGKLDVKMVKAEICANINMKMDSHEFAHYIKDKKSLLEAAKSDKKYNKKK
jgi:predicted DNA-binding antitoxin AbrB/MazE fold protein